MQLLTATLAENPKAITTKYGEKTVADITTEAGETLALWRPANDSTLLSLRRGDRVTIAKDSKGKISLIDNTASSSTPAAAAVPTATQPANAYTLDSDTKKAIAEYLKQQRDLLQFCWQQAETIEGPQTEDSIEKLAVTLYLSAQRKFNLT